MNARWSGRYRARLDEPPSHAPDYVMLCSFEVKNPGSYIKRPVAIFHNENLGVYFWRQSVFAGKINGKFSWMDCLTMYQSLGDVITDIAQYYYERAIDRAQLHARIGEQHEEQA